MEKESKGVTPTDVTRVKKQEEKELKERTKKYDEMLEKDKKSQENKPTFDIPKKQEKQTFDPTGPKNQRQTGIDWKKKSSDASQDLPTTKKMWEENSGIPEKRSPFKYIKTEKKKAALDILKKAGFGKKAQVSKDLYMKLKNAEDALRALWSALSTGGDPMASVEQQREIESLLQKMQAWHKELTGGQ